MNQRLDGRSPLAYMGVKPTTPTQMVINKDRRPTTNDLQNFQLGTWWIIPTRSSAPTNEVWILINKTASAATWIELDSGGGSVVPGAQYTLLTADGSGGYGPNVGPGTAGQVLLSGGASANPDYVTPTAGSGLSVTTNASTLEYSLSSNVVLGLAGNTGGNILPNVSGIINVVGTGSISVSGASNTLTISDSGAGSGFNTINVQTFTSNGTYTPTSNMAYCIVEIVGGGGAGGPGIPASGPNPGNHSSSGGGGGGYCRKVFDAATIGASQSVTIGAGGTGNTSTTPAASGGNTTFGALLTANGGGGGYSFKDVSAIGLGSGGTAASGDINIPGQAGGFPVDSLISAGGSGSFQGTGIGGGSIYGFGGEAALGPSGNVAGNDGTGYGSGGSGGYGISLARAGGDGADGICIVTEFIE